MKAELDADDRGPLGFALGAAARKLAKFYTKALVDHKLTPSQLFFLRQLWREDGLQLRELGLRALRTFAESSEENGTEANHGDNVTRK